MNNEQVGVISYAVEIDIDALKKGTKSAEEAIKTSFDASDKKVRSATKSMDNSLNSTVKTLGVLTAAIVALNRSGDFLKTSIDSANRFEASMKGLDSVAGAFTGDVQGAREAAQQLASDGLLPLSDAATGLKNLLAAGYGLEEAIVLMERFKDSAAFGRQGSLQFGEAIRTATEGIKNGNSILVDNAGVTKNLSVILQEAGYSAQDLQHATSDAGVRMAILNGIVRETNAQMGDAAKLTETAAGADARLAFATEQLEVRVGSLANTLRMNTVNSLAQFITTNQDAIISIGSGIAAAASLVAGIFAVNSALRALIPVLSLVARHPVVAALTLLVGVVASLVVSDMLRDLESGLEGVGDGADKATPSLQNMSNAASDTAKQLRKLDEQIARTNRDYLESLAQIVRRHQESVTELTKQIEDENARYNRAIQERTRDFEDEQDVEVKKHQEKTKNLQNQIDFLRKYNNKNNAQQLSELEFALARENNEYRERNSELQKRYQEDVAAENTARNKKLADLNAQLSEEQGILNKHRDSVKAIRNVMLLDEIELLKRTHQEQLKAYEEQRAEIVSQARSTGQQAGTEAAKAFNKAFGAEGVYFDAATRYDVQKIGGRTYVTPQFDTGGFTGRGNALDPAGVVHKGEYVIPKPLVNQATGLPKAEAFDSLASPTSSTSNNYDININVQGAIVTSAQDQRKFAEVIGKRLNEIMAQKGYTPSIQGV